MNTANPFDDALDVSTPIASYLLATTPVEDVAITGDKLAETFLEIRPHGMIALGAIYEGGSVRIVREGRIETANAETSHHVATLQHAVARIVAEAFSAFGLDADELEDASIRIAPRSRVIEVRVDEKPICHWTVRAVH